MHILKRIRDEFLSWIRTAASHFPGELGIFLRRKMIPSGNIGKGVRIQPGTWIDYPENLSIGHKTEINRSCFLNAGGTIEIGTNVLIGPNVTIYSQNHNFRDRATPICTQGYTRKRVVIENDSWICARAVILPGVRIAEGTVVAAGAVVTKDTEPYSIVAGVPATQIGKRS